MGEQQPAEQDVVDSKPGQTNMIMLSFETLSQLRLTRHWVVTLGHWPWPCPPHPFFIN